MGPRLSTESRGVHLDQNSPDQLNSTTRASQGFEYEGSTETLCAATQSNVTEEGPVILKVGDTHDTTSSDPSYVQYVHSGRCIQSIAVSILQNKIFEM